MLIRVETIVVSFVAQLIYLCSFRSDMLARRLLQTNYLLSEFAIRYRKSSGGRLFETGNQLRRFLRGESTPIISRIASPLRYDCTLEVLLINSNFRKHINASKSFVIHDGEWDSPINCFFSIELKMTIFLVKNGKKKKHEQLTSTQQLLWRYSSAN